MTDLDAAKAALPEPEVLSFDGAQIHCYLPSQMLAMFLAGVKYAREKDAQQQEPCIGNDPLCPCQDGLACHYRDAGGTKAFQTQDAKDATRWRYWLKHHGWSGYFDDGASNEDSPSAVNFAIDAAIGESMK